MASGGRRIANSNASAVRVSGKWCEKSAVSEARWAETRFIACRKSVLVAQLEPKS